MKKKYTIQEKHDDPSVLILIQAKSIGFKKWTLFASKMLTLLTET